MAGKRSKWTQDRLNAIQGLLDEKIPEKEIAHRMNVPYLAIRWVVWKYKLKSSYGTGKLKEIREKKDDLASRMMFLTGQSPDKPEVPVHFEDSELLSWSSGVEGFDKFCNEVLGITMQSFQLGMTRELLGYKRLCFLLGRGAGKDFWASGLAVWLCIVRANFKVLLVSGAQRQSDLLMTRIQQHLVKHDKLFASVFRGTMETIRFRNNSEINSLPSSAFIRGFQDVDLIICNEAAFIPNSSEYVQSVILPMLGTKNGSLCLMSTPLSSSNDDVMFWSYNSPLFRKIRYPSSISRYITKEFLEEQKNMLPVERYNQEYGADFMDVINCLFSSGLIDRIRKEYDLVEAREPDKKYYIGWDAGRIRDASVVIVISKDKAYMLRVENIYAFERTDFPTQEAMIARIIQIYQPEKICCEYAGLSMGSVDHLIQLYGNKIVKFIPTAPEKMKSYDKLKLKMEQGILTIPNHQKLITELKFFQFKVSPSGNILLHHSGGYGDDYADALMMAVHASEGVPFVFLTCWDE